MEVKGRIFPQYTYMENLSVLVMSFTFTDSQRWNISWRLDERTHHNYWQSFATKFEGLALHANVMSQNVQFLMKCPYTDHLVDCISEIWQFHNCTIQRIPKCLYPSVFQQVAIQCSLCNKFQICPKFATKGWKLLKLFSLFLRCHELKCLTLAEVVFFSNSGNRVIGRCFCNLELPQSKSSSTL
jgi:hypothetical protein